MNSCLNIQPATGAGHISYKITFEILRARGETQYCLRSFLNHCMSSEVHMKTVQDAEQATQKDLKIVWDKQRPADFITYPVTLQTL